jgi:hypothetical protein
MSRPHPAIEPLQRFPKSIDQTHAFITRLTRSAISSPIARDAVAAMTQDASAVLAELNALPTKGGGEGPVSKLLKQLKETEGTLGAMPDEGGGRATSDDFMNGYKLKQAVGRYSGFGKPEFLRTHAENELSKLFERMRVGFEDEATWGPAGSATREWNESFATAKGRRDDFGIVADGQLRERDRADEENDD